MDLMSDGYLESKRNQAGFSKARTWEISDYEGCQEQVNENDSMITRLHLGHRDQRRPIGKRSLRLPTFASEASDLGVQSRLSWTRMLEEAA